MTADQLVFPIIVGWARRDGLRVALNRLHMQGVEAKVEMLFASHAKVADERDCGRSVLDGHVLERKI